MDNLAKWSYCYFMFPRSLLLSSFHSTKFSKQCSCGSTKVPGKLHSVHPQLQDLTNRSRSDLLVNLKWQLKLKVTCVVVVIQNGFLLESLQLQHHGLNLRGRQTTEQITQQPRGQCSFKQSTQVQKQNKKMVQWPSLQSDTGSANWRLAVKF